MTDTRIKANANEEANNNPFGLEPPDENEELDALTRALSLTNGFALFIVSCNQAPNRDRLMDEIESRLPDARIQRISVQQETRNLIYLLREHLESPTPHAVCVYGMEAWLPAGKAAENSPFVLNLNAARNYFPADVPCPMVLWLPQHLVIAIAHGAPDFFSIRSGLYAFSPTPQVRKLMFEELSDAGYWAHAGLSYEEKLDRIADLTTLLHEYEALPSDLREPLTEASLAESLALLYDLTEDTTKAQSLLQRALEIRTRVLGEEHLDTATSLNSLANHYAHQGDFHEAESLYQRALAIREKQLGPNHPETATIENNLANLYTRQNKFREAEQLYNRALATRQKWNAERPSVAATLNNLARLYRATGRYVDAESLFLHALDIRKRILGLDHPDVAASLNNLAALYHNWGRYAEAEPLYRQALEIRERVFSPQHSDVARTLENLAFTLRAMGRLQEANEANDRAQAIRKMVAEKTSFRK